MDGHACTRMYASAGGGGGGGRLYIYLPPQRRVCHNATGASNEASVKKIANQYSYSYMLFSSITVTFWLYRSAIKSRTNLYTTAVSLH